MDWLLGSGYRDLWAEPIEAEVLDLGSTAGGLTPVMTVGGLQTLGLALAGEDGRSYTFRSVDKGSPLVLPEGFRGSGVELFTQDPSWNSGWGGAMNGLTSPSTWTSIG